jgi:hypothetical protein
MLTVSMPRLYRTASLVAILFTCVVINLLFVFVPWPHSNFPDNLEQFSYHAGIPYSNRASSQISNGTLGFGKIFLLGLPSRSDKRDSMQLAASLTNLNITWVDGVDGEEMGAAEIPPAFFDPAMYDLTKRTQIGSWRGHMNAIRRVVDENLQSALILEDDVDWDVNIIAQLQQFANASIALLENLKERPGNGSEPAISTSPYGDGWDILWLGHCGGWIPPADYRQYNTIISSDSTVPPSIGIFDMLNGVRRADSGSCAAHRGRDPNRVTCDSPRLLPDQRIVQVRTSPICSFAYALSQKGARKALLYLGGPALADIKASFDTILTEVCRGQRDISGGEETTCLTVSPPYFVHHHTRGSATGDSDMSSLDEKDRNVTTDMGFTKGIVFSTRLNAANLIEGREAESQYIWTNERTGWRFRHRDEYHGGQNEKNAAYKAGVVG